MGHEGHAHLEGEAGRELLGQLNFVHFPSLKSVKNVTYRNQNERSLLVKLTKYKDQLLWNDYYIIIRSFTGQGILKWCTKAELRVC